MSPKTITFVVLFAFILVVWAAFVVIYAVSTGGQWRRTPEGRHLMSLALVFVWNCLLILINVVFRQYPGRFPVQLISYSAFGLIGVQRIFLLLRAQRARRQRRAAEVAAIALATRSPDEPRG